MERERPRPMALGPEDWVERARFVGFVGELRAELLMKSFWLLFVSMLEGPLLKVFEVAACPTQKSQSAQPRTVKALPQLTTLTGERRCW